MLIKLKCHSSTPGAVGYIGEIIDADPKVAQWLIDDNAAVLVKPFAEFVEKPVDVPATQPVEAEPKADKAPVVRPTGNPKRAAK